MAATGSLDFSRPGPAGVPGCRAARARRLPSPGTAARPGRRTRWTSGSSPAGAGPGSRARCSRPAAPTSRASPAAWKPRAGPRAHPAAVHHRRVLHVRRRGGTPGPLARGACPPSPAGLRVARDRAGPQLSSARSWSPPGSGRPPSAGWSPCSRSTGCACPRPPVRISSTLGLERGHRTLVITRKGAKVVTIPLAPSHRPLRSTWRSASAPKDPSSSPSDGERLDRHGAARIVRRGSPGAPGSPNRAARTRSGTSSSPPPLMPGVSLLDAQEAASHADLRTTIRYDPARAGQPERHATYIVATCLAGAAGSTATQIPEVGQTASVGRRTGPRRSNYWPWPPRRREPPA